MEDLFKTDKNFKRLSDEERKILIEYCVIKHVKKDEVLCKDGEEGSEAFIVKEGMVRISKKILTDETVTLAVAKRGMIFGEMAIFDVSPRYADAVALVDGELIVLTKEKFNDIREKYPKTALILVDIFITFLAFYLRKTTDRAYGIFH